MSDQALLRDLCSICNTSKSKYRCPGCAARTCSLPCYKRHQQWAQCSGQRDATKFVKKSQLVTPAGIDHDFNFLTAIERDLEKAERTVSATAAHAPADAAPLSRSQRAGTQYARLEALSGVTIIRAPKGLSRQRENRSHPSSSKKSKPNVVWTVEWLNEAADRVLTDTSSTQALALAHPFAAHKSKKRKLNAEDDTPTVTSIAEDDTTPVNPTTLENATPPPAHQNRPLQPLQQALHLDPEHQQHHEHPSTRPGTTSQRPRRPSSPTTTGGEAPVAHPHPRNPRPHEPPAQPLGHEHHRFYLLKPRTSSPRHVLIPLPPEAMLAEALRGCQVLEFPTIYVFAGAGALPDAFMLEDEYVAMQGEEQREFDELLRDLDPEILARLREERGTREEGKEEVLDGKRILDVLKQDLGGAF